MPDKRTVIDPDTGVASVEKIKYRIKDLVGVASLAKLGKDVITTHIDSGKPTKLEELVDNLTVVDWEKSPTNKWMRSQAGFAGQKELYTLLYELAYNGAEPESTEFVELEGEVLEDA